jgi:NAD(P)-dependent dehydrogenase (short-subunit alcohol dehydrogenase family)
MAVALVTGTSTGIGFATAEALARAGHDVFAAMRNPERAPSLVGDAIRAIVAGDGWQLRHPVEPGFGLGVRTYLVEPA